MLCLGHHFQEPPALGFRKGPGLANSDGVSFVRDLPFIVHLVACVPAHELAVLGMPLEPGNLYSTGFLHLVARDDSRDHLSRDQLSSYYLSTPDSTLDLNRDATGLLRLAHDLPPLPPPFPSLIFALSASKVWRRAMSFFSAL